MKLRVTLIGAALGATLLSGSAMEAQQLAPANAQQSASADRYDEDRSGFNLGWLGLLGLAGLIGMRRKDHDTTVTGTR